MRNRWISTATVAYAATLLSASAWVSAQDASYNDTAQIPREPDRPLAKSYDDAAKALAMADDNPVIRWEYNIWCVTGHRHPNEVSPGEVVDAALDLHKDHFSPKGFHLNDRITHDQWMPKGGARFMDNAWYVGKEGTGAIIVRTPDGLLVMDTMNNGAEFDRVLKEMPLVGLDPKDIKYVFLGHHHGDHIGGVNAILKVAPDAKIVAGAPDADIIDAGRKAVLYGTVHDLPPENHAVSGWRNPTPADPVEAAKVRATRLANLPNRIDIRVQPQPGLDAGSLTIHVGPQTDVVAILTPGHSPGQMQVIVPVEHQGKLHKLLVWSGNDRPDNALQYAISVDYLRAVAAKEGADALINTHGYQSAFFYHVRQANANPTGPNPILMGVDGVDRYIGVFENCQRAMYHRLKDGTWRSG